MFTLKEQKILLWVLKLSQNPNDTLSIPCDLLTINKKVSELIFKLEASTQQLEEFKHDLDIKLI